MERYNSNHISRMYIIAECKACKRAADIPCIQIYRSCDSQECAATVCLPCIVDHVKKELKSSDVVRCIICGAPSIKPIDKIITHSTYWVPNRALIAAYDELVGGIFECHLCKYVGTRSGHERVEICCNSGFVRCKNCNEYFSKKVIETHVKKCM